MIKLAAVEEGSGTGKGQEKKEEVPSIKGCSDQLSCKRTKSRIKMSQGRWEGRARKRINAIFLRSIDLHVDLSCKYIIHGVGEHETGVTSASLLGMPTRNICI
jgi:hypothetical protein